MDHIYCKKKWGGAGVGGGVDCSTISLLRDACMNKKARCSSVVRAFDHGAMGRRIDPSCIHTHLYQ